jgi:vacuolar-type H+-ATPase subunit C/Vma6
MTGWEDVISRVRGLSSRLVGRPALEQLSKSPDLSAMLRGLAGTPYAAIPEAATNDSAIFERATRRVAAEHLHVLLTWCGARVGPLIPLFEDEDRRNLRAVTRAIAAEIPIDQRTAGLLPTPSLPLPLLDELARQPRLRDVAAMLSSWGNPYGAAMTSESLRPHADLFSLQLAIDKAYFRRARDAADDAGTHLLSYIALQIDAENLRSAFAAVRHTIERDPRELFIEGGGLVSREDYDRLCGEEPTEARLRVERLVAGTPLAPLAALDRHRDVDADMLAAMIRHLRRTVRIVPLSLAVLLDYMLRLRAEIHDIARIVWGIALGIPRRRIDAALVTP